MKITCHRHAFTLVEILIVGAVIFVFWGVVAYLCDDEKPQQQAETKEERSSDVQQSKKTSASSKGAENKNGKADAVDASQTRDVKELQNTPLEKWTEAKKSNNRQLFNSIHIKNLQNTVSELKNTIRDYKLKQAGDEEKVKAVGIKIRKTKALLDAYKAAVRTKKFPARVQGVQLTEEEIREEWVTCIKELQRLESEQEKHKKQLQIIADQLKNFDEELRQAQSQLTDAQFREKEFKVIQATDRLNDITEGNRKNDRTAQVFSDDNNRKFEKEGKKADGIREADKELLKGLYE